MWARKRVDISWSDLAFAAMRSMMSPREDVARELEDVWNSNTLACLSVRSSFDLYLSALDLPKGSEVLVSAITIPDMVRIVEQHGLFAVPIDLDEHDLSVSLDSLATAVTDQSKVMLVAHLCGSIMPLDAIMDFAQDHGLLVFEDCAQAFVGPKYKGHPEADAVAFSFGPIKTATALGGALITIRDEVLLGSMRELLGQHIVQSRFAFARRVLKYCLLKLLGTRYCFRMLYWLACGLGQGIDCLLASSARNFGGGDLLLHLRKQPCGGLVALMSRRIRQFDMARCEQRAALGDRFRAALGSGVRSPGAHAAVTSHWVYAIRPAHQATLVAELRSAGFDATNKTSMRALAPVSPRGRSAPVAETLLPELVFVPLYPEMPADEVDRMATVILAAKSETLQNSEPFGI